MWLDSFFGQQVKDGFTIPENKQLLDPRVYLLYSENLEIWAREFGKNNVLIRVYDEHITDVVDDFCQLINLHSLQLKKLDRDSENVNTRLTSLASEIMRKTHALNIDSKTTDLIKKVLKETSFYLINQNQQFGARTFTKEFLEKICTVYQNDIESLKRKFPSTQSITDCSPNSPQATVHPETYCPEQAVQQLIADLVTLLHSFSIK